MEILGRTSKLAQLVEQRCQQISSLDPKRDGPAMLEQVCSGRPDKKSTFESLFSGVCGEIVRPAFGEGLVRSIKVIPQQIDFLVQRINDPSSTAALRCALIAVLAYVVQRRDIVPDDAPAGYGFIDDHALLTATMLHLTEPTSENAQTIEALNDELTRIESILPLSAGPALTRAIQSVVRLIQHMSALPPELAESMTQQLLDDPEGVALPSAPPDWQPPMPSPRREGRFAGGAYIEGNDIMFPGGASLIGGQLHLPLPASS